MNACVLLPLAKRDWCHQKNADWKGVPGFRSACFAHTPLGRTAKSQSASSKELLRTVESNGEPMTVNCLPSNFLDSSKARHQKSYRRWDPAENSRSPRGF